MGLDRVNRLRIAPPRTPHPTLRRYAHSRHQCPWAPGNAPPKTSRTTGNTPTAHTEPESAASRTADHPKSAHLAAKTIVRKPTRLFWGWALRGHIPRLLSTNNRQNCNDTTTEESGESSTQEKAAGEIERTR